MLNLSTIVRRASIGAFATVLGATAAIAQKPAADPRWEAWLGCWQPSLTGQEVGSLGSFVCVRPTSVASAVEIATVDSGRIVTRDTIDASGSRRNSTAQGCTGWRTGEWSADSRRVYLKSELTCSTGFSRTSTGVLAMSSTGDWLDIQSASVSGNSAVRAVRYREMGSWNAPDLPAELAGVIPASGSQPNTARMLATTALTTKDVIDASKHLDSVVMQAWIVERDQSFDIDARDLLELRKAGVPGSVTDVMIAVSYPEQFALQNAASKDGSMQPTATYGNRVRDARFESCVQTWDPYWYSPYDYDPCGYRYSYGAYGANRAYYGYGSYGYYGPSYGGGYYSPVVVVVKNDPPHGKVVKGQGYTRGRASSGDDSDRASTSSQPERTSGSSGRSSSGSSAGRSSGSSSGSSGGSSSGSTGTGRTAQARPPGKGQ